MPKTCLPEHRSINAVAESFFATVKTELVHHSTYRSQDHAKAELFEYMEVFYNRNRRHSTLGDQTPAGFEMTILAA
jgi:transposase InsO family protein